MTDSDQVMEEFLNKCSIVFDDYSQLDGMLIPRDVLLSGRKSMNL